MFRRAVKQAFDENKYKQVTTRRVHHAMDNLQPATRRVGAFLGTIFGFSIIKWYRKERSEKALYIPQRMGIGKLQDMYPIYAEMEKGSVYGYGPQKQDGRPSFG